MEQKPIDFYVYETNVGYYYKHSVNLYFFDTSYLINSTPPVQAEGGFYFSKEPITSVSVKKAGSGYIEKFTLRSPLTATPTLPEEIPFSESGWEYDDDDGKYKFNGKYETLYAFYEPVYKYTEPCFEDVPFNIIVKGTWEVTSPFKQDEMKIRITNTNRYSDKPAEVSLSSFVCYDDLEKAITPAFLLHSRPCSLTSKQVYQIVRQHIKDNYDRSVAQLSSDYDFCFTVKKVIHTDKEKKQEILTAKNKSYRPPKFKTVKITESVDVFEMTWDGAGSNNKGGYGNYTVISPWHADNLQEMKENIGQYLKGLMEEINKPLTVCQCCGGYGVMEYKIGTNERGGK